MGNLTFKPTEETIAQVIKDFRRHELFPYADYEVRRFKSPDLSIVLYTSGKMLVQGPERAVNLFATRYKTVTQPVPLKVKPSTASNSGRGRGISTDEGDIVTIGSDETGTGSYFGHVIVATVCITSRQEAAWLQELKVGDSKQIKDADIRRLAPMLMERLTHKVVRCPNKDYNRAIEQGHNANSLKASLHNYALLKLIKTGVDPQRVVIDAFCSRENWDRYLERESQKAEEFLPVKVDLIEKAESQFLSVAAASIIARYEFLKSLEEDAIVCGEEVLPSGAGAAVDAVGRKVVALLGESGLKRFAKWHFANTQKILGS